MTTTQLSGRELDCELAKALGWNNVVKWPYDQGWPPGESLPVSVPLYSSDLNVMHQVEKGFIKRGNHADYTDTLEIIVRDGEDDLPNVVLYWRFAHASALQRARAALETLRQGANK